MQRKKKNNHRGCNCHYCNGDSKEEILEKKYLLNDRWKRFIDSEFFKKNYLNKPLN